MASTVLAGRYHLGQPLGKGGMATVYLAHDDLLDRAVAVKMLRVDGEATARERFAAEARAAGSVTHPHAVAVYDVSSANDRPFIVMELVQGNTLEDELAEQGRLRTNQVIAVGCQVLGALHAAHRRGLVHRDVKPANILLPDGVVPSRPDELPGVKLADFGIAKAMHDATIGLTMAGQVIGTPRYLSPEQVSGHRATPQSDLYATAVVLYEALAGRPPFQHDSAVGLALAHREDDPPPLGEARPELDPDLVALIHRALAKDPADRPADANEMRHALLHGLRGATAGTGTGTQLLPGPAAGTRALTQPDGTRPAGTAPAPLAPPPQPRRTPRLLWWVVVIALLAVVGLLAAQLTTGTSPVTDQPTAEPQAPAEADQPAGGGQPAGGDQPAEQPAEQQDTAPQPDPQPSAVVEPQPSE